MSDKPEKQEKNTWVEEVEIAGNNLVEHVKGLLQESATSRVVIYSSEGHELMTIPLTLSVVVGGVITFTAPVLAALGAVAALVTRVRLKVIRELKEGVEKDADSSEKETDTDEMVST